MELTERETQIVYLRDEEGLTWAEVAERLGTTKSSVNSSYRAAKAKASRVEKPYAALSEVYKPDETAAVLDLATDPFTTIKDAAKACGFPESTLKQLMRRMKARYKPLDSAIQKVKSDELVRLLDDRAKRALHHIDDFAMAGASVKDLAITAGIMIDKSQLLKGMPTQIMGNEERKKLNDLVPKLLAEAKRRGVTIEGMKTTYTVEKDGSAKKDE